MTPEERIEVLKAAKKHGWYGGMVEGWTFKTEAELMKFVQKIRDPRQTKSMETLDDFNKRRNEVYDAINMREPRPNGIECPKCKHELIDSCPEMILTSIPPKKNVHCPECGYVGYRVA